MGLQTLKVELPDSVMQRLESLAATTNQPLDAILMQTIRGNLPPSLEDVPVEYRDDLGELLRLSSDDLYAVASVSPDPRRWRRHESLLHKHAENTLPPIERQELDQLRMEMDRLVYRRSFAMALLKWRGHELSSLIANPSHAPT
jgi:hypothetical protein